MTASNDQARTHWSEIDTYLEGLVLEPDPVLEATLEASSAAGMPQIEMAPNHAKLLHLLARVRGARTILEIGTLAGYSTIWLARALPPDGRLITLEASERHAEVARRNIAHAGLTDVVEVVIGSALDTLPRLADSDVDPFDLVFIDADKEHNPDYFTWALALTRPGSLIIVDNVVRGGTVLDATSTDPAIRGTRALGELIATERRVSATMIQTVSGKGHDGIAVALVVD